MNQEIYVWYKNQYPKTLQNMPAVPEKMYVRGKLHLEPDRKFLCVVGSRRATPYGKDCVNKILEGLRGYPISIVSGLAQGMDSYAHEAALETGLHCIAFPGSSLSWPQLDLRNNILPRKILAAGGALVSRWPPDYDIGNWCFPARNMLMAGICHAVLIIEAAHRSGALMTAGHAVKYDRDAMAVPGPINAALSYGPHMLIKNGAALIRSGLDILHEFGFNASEESNKFHLVKLLDPLAQAIYKEISLSGETNSDMIIDRLGINALALNEKLSILELKGLIKVTLDGIKLV